MSCRRLRSGEVSGSSPVRLRLPPRTATRVRVGRIDRHLPDAGCWAGAPPNVTDVLLMSGSYMLQASPSRP